MPDETDDAGRGPAGGDDVDDGGAEASGTGSDDDFEYRFDPEDFDTDGGSAAGGVSVGAEAGETPDVDAAEDSQGNVAGTLPTSGDVEPQPVSREHALFVALGAYVAVLGGLFLVSPSGVPPTRLAAVTAAVAVGSLAVYALLARADPTT